MAPAMASTGTLPLVSGIAVAAVLSAGAVFAVAQAGCDEPGSYRQQDGVVEPIGGCVQAEDLPVSPEAQDGGTPHTTTNTSVAP